MSRIIIPRENEAHLEEALERFLAARHPAALTGAGISVESGIPDFRSPGGLWTVFTPEEYATLEVFLDDPEKAWKLYRALGKSLEGIRPNPAHRALARLEQAGRLAGIVTQNVDGLHQAAGSRRVIEMHGDHQRLHCLDCKKLEAVRREHYESGNVPACRHCGRALKPNVVLFGEDVRRMDEINRLLEDCDLLLVVGTSAQVYPAAGLPDRVKMNGGSIYEFNMEATHLTRGVIGGLPFAGALSSNAGKVETDFFFKGKAGDTLPLLVDRVV